MICDFAAVRTPFQLPDTEDAWERFFTGDERWGVLKKKFLAEHFRQRGWFDSDRLGEVSYAEDVVGGRRTGEWRSELRGT